MINVLITGGTGLVGKALVELLNSKGYNVAVLSRSKKINGIQSFYWDYEKGVLEDEAIEFADVIIHLAGENISNKRWTKKQKQKIVDSRVKTTNLLYDKIKTAKSKPRIFISASAIGYYGTFTSDKIFKEDDGAGNDFLAKTVVEWERSVNKISELNLRVVILRTGVVFSEKGGALPKILKPIKLGFGAAIGNGKQYIPWIDVNDLAQMYLFAIENEKMNSIYNAVTPFHITNYELTKKLAKKLNRSFFMPNIPAFIMKLIFGEMASILLYGSQVSSEKIEKEGFGFKNISILKN